MIGKLEQPQSNVAAFVERIFVFVEKQHWLFVQLHTGVKVLSKLVPSVVEES